jgi:hypothetical protein
MGILSFKRILAGPTPSLHVTGCNSFAGSNTALSHRGKEVDQPVTMGLGLHMKPRHPPDLKVRPAGLEPATPCLEGRCSIL